MIQMSKDTKKRTVFTLKLTDENYKKIKEESKKLELTMSAFMSMLIASYEGLDIKYTNNN